MIQNSHHMNQELSLVCNPIHDKLWVYQSRNHVPVTKQQTDVTTCIFVKPNGQLHMCLYPRDLNLAIKRDYYRTPVWTNHTWIGWSTLLLSWMVPYHIHVLSLNMSHPCWQLETYHGDDTVFLCLCLVCAHNNLPMNDRPHYLMAVMTWLQLQMMSSSIPRMMKNMTDASTSWLKWFMNTDLCLMVESVLSNSHPWASLNVSMTRMGHIPDPAKVSTVHNTLP